jgi:hypothetical protein
MIHWILNSLVLLLQRVSQHKYSDYSLFFSRLAILLGVISPIKSRVIHLRSRRREHHYYLETHFLHLSSIEIPIDVV